MVLVAALALSGFQVAALLDVWLRRAVTTK